ncbi:MAG: MBL fold metallo-hydrolase [Candidatus Azobacteroides sp.]|nr:MBL fold metallo-hydrolase [Candidatus Azobacteroides sp.]
MIVKQFAFNPFPVNTYLVYDDTKEAVIIDPGMVSEKEREELDNFILENGLTVTHLLNTHLHFDHVLGNNYIFYKYGLKPEAHADDLFLLNGLKSQAALFGFSVEEDPVSLKNYLDEKDTVLFGNSSFKIMHVPGHSPGSLVFYSPAAGILFAGDVLFQGSIGRTDLPGGNYDVLMKSLKDKVLTLPEETVVYPGHGYATSIQKEKYTNPFLT